MRRLQVLSTITLLLSIALTAVSSNLLDTTSVAWLVTGWIGVILGSSCIGTALLVLFLSLFAITPRDGVYVIDSSTRYGRFFLRFTSLKTNHDHSYCKLFWKTNLALFMVAAILAAAGVVVTVVLSTPNVFGEIASGLWWVITLVFTAIKWIFMIVLAVAVAGFLTAGARLAVEEMQQTQFGEVAKTFHKEYMCPRIRVEP